MVSVYIDFLLVFSTLKLQSPAGLLKHFFSFPHSDPPEHVRIRKEPDELRAGTIATLTCDGSSSNPPAEMSWWREGISVTDGIANSSKPGLHGGVVSSITLKLNVTPEIDGDVYTCQASNTALQRSTHDAITMHVLCEYNSLGTMLEKEHSMSYDLSLY